MSGTAIGAVPVSRSIKYAFLTKPSLTSYGHGWTGWLPDQSGGSIMVGVLSHKENTNEAMRGDHVTISRRHDNRCR